MKHPQRRWWDGYKLKRELRKFKETGVVSDWLAKRAARDEHVRQLAFPLICPPPPPFEPGQWFGIDIPHDILAGILGPVRKGL